MNGGAVADTVAGAAVLTAAQDSTAPRARDVLAGKPVAVVVGAGTPVGRAVALALAGSDALVYCADLHSGAAATTAAAIVAGGGRACERSVDVTERDEVDALFDRIVAERGRIDMVCGVATARSHASLLHLSDGAIERTVVASVRGAFVTCQAAARVMAAHGGGIIVNVVGPGVGAGGVASAAIDAITTELAAELAPSGVRVATVDGGDPGAAVGRLALAEFSERVLRSGGS